MDMSCSPVLVKEARTNNYYYIDGAHDRLYILTNYSQENSNYQVNDCGYVVLLSLLLLYMYVLLL